MARTAPPRILIAEDEDRLRRVFDMLLSGAGYQISLAEDGEAAWSDFQSEPPDVVITDLRMPKLGGMDLLKRIKCDRPETPVIVVTAFGAVDSAVEAMKAGAADFLTKPVEEEKLRLAIQKALEWREIVSENLRLRAASRKQYDFSAIIATSKAMRETLQLAGQVAMSDATALIYGESGTGKELVARAIHINSRRSRSPFEAVN